MNKLPELLESVEQIEAITLHVTHSISHNGQIHVLTLTSVAWQDYDAFATRVENLTASLEPGQKLLMLFDLSAPGITLTPYIKQRTEELRRKIPGGEITGRSAILLSNSILSRAVQLFLRLDVLRNFRNHQYQIFFDRQKALDWLVEELSSD